MEQASLKNQALFALALNTQVIKLELIQPYTLVVPPVKRPVLDPLLSTPQEPSIYV